MTNKKPEPRMRVKCGTIAGNLLGLAAAVALVVGLAVTARAQADEGPTSTLHVSVVRETDGKPVKNAQVVLHPVNRKGKATRGEIELKTDADGHANVDGIPYGTIEVQVLAPGFRTFGEDYPVNQAATEIAIKLKRPGGQYSTYENHDDKKPQ
jgi:hypothetical protein